MIYLFTQSICNRRLSSVIAGILMSTLANGLSSPMGFAETTASKKVSQNFTTPIPSGILTPDTVKTSIGTFNFFDGLPDKASANLAYENLDFIRAYEIFLSLMPAASIEMLRQGHKKMGVGDYSEVMLMSPLESNPIFLTGNTDTVYGSVFFDLSKTGPLVINIPAGLGPGTINDAFFRFVADTGAPGPDRGKGGKYLILGPSDQEPSGSKDYFVFRSPTYSNWLIMRAFLDENGSPDKAVQSYKSDLHIYPFHLKDSQPKMKFIEAGDLVFNTVHANNFEFFVELNKVIQREPINFLDPEIRGLASSIGMEKGVPFNPPPALRSTMEEAVQVGVAYARSEMTRPRDRSAYLYDGKQWTTPFVGGSHEWLRDGGKGGRNLDARAMYFWLATVNTPAMVLEMPGVGSQYGLIATDSQKKFLNGGKNYRLNLPANIPAKDFWSFVVYDPQTRSELQTTQALPSKNSKRNKDILINDDGSVDLYFGPKAPNGKASNWIQTIPEKGWFALLRLYGPLESWFDESWQPNDIQKLD